MSSLIFCPFDPPLPTQAMHMMCRMSSLIFCPFDPPLPTQAMHMRAHCLADLKTENENLQNALDELLKLKPVCVDSGMSWEERTARREQEIESLKEALKILEETDFGFLQSKRH